MIFDLIQIVAAIAYMTCLAVGIYHDRRSAQSRHVDRAVGAFMLAALAATIDGAAALMRVDEYGWTPVGFAGFFLAGTVAVITLTVARADRMEASR